MNVTLLERNPWRWLLRLELSEPGSGGWQWVSAHKGARDAIEVALNKMDADDPTVLAYCRARTGAAMGRNFSSVPSAAAREAAPAERRSRDEVRTIPLVKLPIMWDALGWIFLSFRCLGILDVLIPLDRLVRRELEA